MNNFEEPEAPKSDSLPSYVQGSGSGAQHRRTIASSRWFWGLSTACVMMILAVAASSVNRSEGSKPPSPSTVPDPQMPPSTTVPSTNAPYDTVELPLGSPTDGLGTKMLPVRAAPDKDLVDGQMITVTGSGFPAGVFIGGVMCTGAAKTKGAAACDLTNIGYNTNTDSKGNFTLQFPVRRYPLIAGQHVDCASGNVDPDDYAALLKREGPKPTTSDPRSATCIVAVGEVSNYDNSGGWPIAFHGETFLHGGPVGATTSSRNPVPGVEPTTTGLKVVTPPPTTAVARTPGTMLAPGGTATATTTTSFVGQY